MSAIDPSRDTRLGLIVTGKFAKNVEVVLQGATLNGVSIRR